jgi:hypothetical protein
MQNHNYADSTTSFPTNDIRLKDSVFTDDKGVIQNFPVWREGLRYETYVPPTIYNDYNFSKNAVAPKVGPQQVRNHTSLNGYSSLYSPNFCKGVR